MANQVPYYFFPPTWDYPPGGPIKLGNVITSLKRPERPIYVAPKTMSIGEAGEVFTTEKYNVEFSRERLRAGKFSILTKFLSAVVGLGVDVGVEVDNSMRETYTFTKITTTQMNPTPSYIQSCLASSNAADLTRYLQISRYRKPLYIITGIKSATATPPPHTSSPRTGTTTGTSSRTQTLSTSVSLEVDGSILSGGTVPIGGGPTLGRVAENKTNMSWEGSSEFVFALRVRKVWVRPGTGDGVEVRKEEDYRKGAFLGSDLDGGYEGGGMGVKVEVEMEDDGVGLEGEMERCGFMREEVVDDDGGGAVYCGVRIKEHDVD